MPITSPRAGALQKTIAAYRRTLAIDSENVGARIDGLGQIYGDPAWGDKTPADTRAGTRPARRPPLTRRTLGAGGRSPGAGTADNAGAKALQLTHDIVRFMDGPRRTTVAAGTPVRGGRDARPRLGMRRATRNSSRAVPVPSSTHRRCHERLKPDETAEGRAGGAGAGRPGRRHNAQSIVIHPMHRPGARESTAVAAADPRNLTNPKTDDVAGRARRLHRRENHELDVSLSFVWPSAISWVLVLFLPCGLHRANGDARAPEGRWHRPRPAWSRPKTLPTSSLSRSPRSRALRSSTITARSARSCCRRRWARRGVPRL